MTQNIYYIQLRRYQIENIAHISTYFLLIGNLMRFLCKMTNSYSKLL
jgi:hypothetical protein